MATDAPLIAAVVDLARVHGYRVHHQRPALVRSGRYASAITGDSGFPDCILAGHGRLIAIECKGVGGYPSSEQRRWLVEFAASGAETLVVRPADLDKLNSVLARHRHVA